LKGEKVKRIAFPCRPEPITRRGGPESGSEAGVEFSTEALEMKGGVVPNAGAFTSDERK
jgi:hypothetical protein